MTPVFFLWLSVFFICVMGARIVIDRTQRSPGRVRIGVAIPAILTTLLAGVIATMVLFLSAGRTPLAGLLLLIGALVVGLTLGPLVADVAARLMVGWLMGTPPEGSLKQIRTFDRAHALIHKNLPEEAVAAYRAELAEDPTQWQGYRELADLLEKLGRADEAVEALRAAIPHAEGAEDRALLQLRVVDLYRGLDKIDAARAVLAQMEAAEWPERIVRAIRTRKQQLSR
jgi:hypothetical protein